MRKGWTVLVSLAALTAGATVSDQAAACGGCFVPPSENTVVTGHRMAMSISPDQSVLWDQIQYAGDPADFSWVLPVKPGARVEVGSDAFFDALDAGTVTSVQAPPEGCKQPDRGGSAFGCSSDEMASADFERGGYGDTGVTVVHEGTVGPYETVTLSTQNPTALEEWLTMNGYALPDAVAPTVAAYVAEGFDFIALKLQPGAGVQQMQPVRVVSPGMVTSLPLRMVAAGAGSAVDLVLFVITEGRYQAANFENTTVPVSLVTWDFKTDSSDYAELRLAALGKNEGRTWLTAHSIKGGLLDSYFDDAAMNSVSYQLANPNNPNDVQFANTIAGAYFRQAQLNGETSSSVDGCISSIEALANDSRLVENTCDENGDNCMPPAANNIAASELACGGMDDLAVAMTGLHPNDVTLTRLEASLPVVALDADLQLEASADQGAVASRFAAGLKANACWDGEKADALGIPGEAPNSPLPPEGLILLTLGAAGVYLAGRRSRRTLPSAG